MAMPNIIPRPPIIRLSIGLPRTCVRHGHTRPRFRVKHPELAGHPAGHGERIWIFDNVLSKQVVYSHTGVLDAHKALRQLPFMGKKSKPAKIRRDQWRQLAMVQFPEGRGVVGQGVFQRLRELRLRHEVEWDDSLMFWKSDDGDAESNTLNVRTKRQRVRALQDQRANSIADLAAVLAGSGRGNKVWITGTAPSQGEVADAKGNTEGVADAKSHDTLCRATIYWNDPLDRNYAQAWSPNVNHDQLREPDRDGQETESPQVAQEV